MKKLVSLILVLVMLISVFASCKEEKTITEQLLDISDEAERAEAIQEYCAEKAETYDSLKTNIESRVIVSNTLSKTEYNSQVEKTQVNIGKNDYHYYSKTTTSKKIGNNVTESTSVEAYDDGKMFLEYSDPVSYVDKKIYGKVALVDFLKYKEDDSEFELDNAKDVSCTHNDDESWTIVYSGYVRNQINALIKKLGLYKFDFGINFYDVALTYQIDKDFNIISYDAQFEFDGSTSSRIEISWENVEFNEAKETKFDLTEYKKVDSIFMLQGFEDDIADLARSNDGSFTLVSEREIIHKQEITTKKLQDATVSYGIKPDGKYFYQLQYKEDGKIRNVAYTNGQQSVRVGSAQLQKTPQTEREAKEYLKGFVFDIIGFDKNIMNGVVKNSDGSYIFSTTMADIGEIEELFDEKGATGIDKTGQTFTVYYNDDYEITKIVSVIQARAYIGELAYTVEETTTLTVEEITDTEAE